MLRLKNLTESLEKKYGLNESHRLNEKFSDDMPDWFAKRILTTKYSTAGDDLRNRDLGGSTHYPSSNGSGYTKRRDYLALKGSKKSPNFGKEPEYRASGGYSPSLFTGLRDMGVRLDTVEVIEGPVPISETDKRLQAPNIPILLFDNGVVYIPGINDNEKLGGRKSLGAYDIAALLPRCEKFAYIDGNNPNNFFDNNEKMNRLGKRTGGVFRKDNHELDRNGVPLGGHVGWGETADKSGYVPIPPMEKYKDKLDEIKANKIYDILKEYEDYLVDVQQEISNYVLSVPMKDYVSIRDNIDYINRRLEIAITRYLKTEQCLNEILNNKSLSPEEQKSELIDLLNGRGNYYYHGGVDDLESSIKDLKSFTKDKFNATIDWI
jgi:hypothetical protein